MIVSFTIYVSCLISILIIYVGLLFKKNIDSFPPPNAKDERGLYNIKDMREKNDI